MIGIFKLRSKRLENESKQPIYRHLDSSRCMLSIYLVILRDLIFNHPINAVSFARTSVNSAKVTRPFRVALRARQSWLFT